MPTSQKRRERKSRKREKIRAEHLRHNRKILSSPSVSNLYSKMTHDGKVPDRNDQVGWDRFNSTHIDLVLKMAIEMNPQDKRLQKFIIEPALVKKDDVPDLEDMLTRAVQKLSCSPPYFIPFIRLMSLESEVQIRQLAFKMRKQWTPFGTAWYHETKQMAVSLVYVDKIPKLFCLSTHAIDRLMERAIHPFKLSLSQITSLMINLEPRKIIYSKPTPVIPLLAGKTLIGYCPYDVHKNMVVAKSFLIPTMTGTPERMKLIEKGQDDFQALTLRDLEDQADFLTKNGIVFPQQEVVT